MAKKKLSYDQIAEKNLFDPLIKEFKEVLRFQKEISDNFKETIKLANEFAKGQGFGDKKQIDALEKSIREVLDTVKDLEKVNADKIKTQQTLNKLELEQKKALAEQKKALADQTRLQREALKEAKALEKERKRLSSSYARESKRLNDLRKRYKDLASAEQENTSEAKAMLKEITKLDKKLKDIDDTVGQNQRSVGNYSDAVKGLGDSFKKLGIVTVIITALEGLKDAFSANTEGAATLEKGFGRFTIAFAVFIGRIIKAFPLFMQGFENMSTSVKKFALESKLSMLEAFNAFGRLNEEIKETKKELSGLVEKEAPDITGIFDGMGEEIEDLIKKNDNLIDTTIRYRKAAIVLTKELSVLRNIQETLSVSADDNTLSLESQIITTKELLKINEDIAEKSIEIAQNELFLAGERAKIHKGNLDFKEQEAEAFIALEEAKTESQVVQLDTERILREIRRDLFEQELDILLDLSDKRKTINEGIAADETETFKARGEALKKSIVDIEESFREQATNIQGQTETAFSIDELLSIEDTSELNKRIRSLGLGEIEINRLREVLMERLQATRDFVVAEKDLNKAISEGLELEKEIAVQNTALIALDLGLIDGKEVLEELEKSTLETEISNLRIRLDMAKDGSKERLEIQKELNEKLLDQHQIRIDKEEQADQEALEKKQEQQEAAFALLKGLADKFNEEKIESIDKEIDATKDREDQLRELAEKGIQDADDNLALNQKRQAELERERARQIKRQQTLELTFAAIQAYSSKVANKDKNPVASTISDVEVIRAFIKSLPAFWDGSIEIGRDINPNADGRDSILALHDKKERIMEVSAAKVVPTGMSNMELALAGKTSRAVNKADSGVMNTEVLSKKLDDINHTIKQQPVYMGLDFDELTSAITHKIVKAGRLERNHHKVGGILG